MWLRYAIAISLFLVSHTPLGWAESLRVGPVYTGEPGMVSVVVELPPGVSPTAGDFHLLVDDHPVATAQRIRAFRDSGQGMALAICVDVSGTMARGPLEEAKKALLAFLDGARPEDRLALISFADAAEIESSFGETLRHHREAVQQLTTRGTQTRLYETLYNTLGIFDDPTLPKRRRLIVISDGKDEGSQKDAAEVINAANSRGIPIDAVGRARIDEQYAEALRSLANSTGGYFEHARRDVRQASDALAAIYEKLSRAPVVDFQYRVGDPGRTTPNAWIELRRGDQPPWRVAVSEAIPQVMIAQPEPKPEAKPEPEVDPIPGPKVDPTPKPRPDPLPEPIPPSGGRPTWLWGVLAALLLALLVVWLRWAKGAQKSDHGSEITPVPPITPIPPTPQPETGFVEPSPRTQVGGYHFPVPGVRAPTAVLLGVSGPMKGQQFSIEKDIVHIGAQSGNDLSIVGDDYLSGNHAYLVYKQGSLMLFDNGSTNGSFVNRHEVTASGVALSLGDHIQLGTSVFELVRGPG